MGEVVQNGFTAFDLADHYGSAELILVSMLSRNLDTVPNENNRAISCQRWQITIPCARQRNGASSNLFR